MKAHTPTPWHVSGKKDINGAYLHIGAATSPMVLASMNSVHTDAEANAEFIVRACNAHDDLVNALQGIEIIERGEGDAKEVWFLLRSDGKDIGAGSIRLTGAFAEAMSKYAKKRDAALTKAGAA